MGRGYGWHDALTESDILARLADLDRRRAEEEKVGIVRWQLLLITRRLGVSASRAP